MKNTVTQCVALVALFTLGFPVISPTLAIAGGDACTASLCAQYHANVINGNDNHNLQGGPLPMSKAYLASSSCGPMPVATSGPGGTPSNTSTTPGGDGGGAAASDSSRGVDPHSCSVPTCDSPWDLCFKDLQVEWGQFAQYCQAIDVANAGHDAEERTLVYYSVAAAVCLSACIFEKSPAGPALKLSCMISDFAAIGGDIAEMVVVNNAADKSIDDWGNTLAASLTAGVGAAAGYVVMNVIAKKGASEILKKATERVGDSCVASVFVAAAAVIKGIGMKNAGDSADDNCNTLQGLDTKDKANMATDLASDTSTAPGSQVSSGAPSAGNGGNGSAGSGASGGSTGNKGPSARSLPASVQQAVRNFPNDATFAAATAGDVFRPAYDAIGGKENMPASLEKATGMSVADLANKLNSGQSLSQALGDIPGFESAAATVGQIEKDIKDGVITAKNGAPLAAGMMTSKGGGGGAKPAAAANPFGNFGMRGPVGGGTPTETTFEKAKRDLAASESSGDIWHEGFGGTIFQIVSHKLDATRDRIDQLEWDTPLNRALVGLPARKH
jgi:hypothetical protein